MINQAGSNQRRKRRTSTTAFGSGKRQAHDASAFYGRFAVPEISKDSHINQHAERNVVWEGDARLMEEVGAIADSSVALVVTSPPYFVGKEYEQSVGEGHVPNSYLEYLQMLEDVFALCIRKLEPGGRIAVNVANLGRKPYRSLAADVISILQNRLKLLLRGEVIWQKAAGANGSCAWGSYQQPGNPVLRDLTERIIIASKGRFDRALSPVERHDRGLPCVGSAPADEFMEATKDIWEIAPESATRVGHPAPFPVELPERLIHLYTYRRDLVLDPFMGSGTTAVAAVRTGRYYVGFDTDPHYVALAQQRAEDVTSQSAAPNSPLLDAWIESAALHRHNGASSPDTTSDPSLVRDGHKTLDVAKKLLTAHGFKNVQERIALPGGVKISLQAQDKQGNPWLFDVAGAFSISQIMGLRRVETVWKVIGQASVLHQMNPDHPPLVVLTTQTPRTNSASARALATVTGPHSPIHAVIGMQSPQDVSQLAVYADSPR